MPKLAQLPVQERKPRADLIEVRRAKRLQTQYFAFLSYSHKDEELAAWLHRELERFHVPRSLAGRITENGVIPRRLRPIFRDEHELAAAGDLGGEIQAAIAASQFLVVLCSPHAAQSRWTNAEIEAFKRVRPDGCVLAAIAAGEPFASEIPGREGEECFPPALRHKYDRRGRPTGRRAEPLAADLRGEDDERRTGFLKLVAGMLGVGLDDLVQRDTTRRHRRLGYLAAASLAGMAVTSSLSVMALQARDAARDQRREAEGLVAFMLGDLKDKLEPIGRLDALDGVGSRVLAYYSQQDAAELSDAALLQRARALSLTAQVAYLRGNSAEAARLYREAMAGTGEAVRRNPKDAQRLFDHAQNVFWVGDMARGLGQIDQAEAAFREYWRLALRMVAIEPDNLKWRMEVQYARENLGIVLMSQRRFLEAARQFEDALGPMQSLASIDPANTEYQKEVSNGLAWLADARAATGRLADATALRQQQVAFLNRLLSRGSTNVVFQEQLIPAYQALGLLFMYRGETKQAVEQFRLGLIEANRLIPTEPGNTMWKDVAARVRLDLAKALLALGRQEEAGAEIAAGCNIAEALRARDSNVARWRTLHTICLDTRSRLALSTGATAQAIEAARRALAAARAERSGDPITDRYRVAAAYRLLGDIRQGQAGREDASAAWSAGLKGLPTNVPERPWEMSERAELLRRVGRNAESRVIADQLAKIGYKGITQQGGTHG